jgi:hypothetical protein
MLISLFAVWLLHDDDSADDDDVHIRSVVEIVNMQFVNIVHNVLSKYQHCA